MNKPLKEYAIWTEAEYDEDGNSVAPGYWEHFETIEDALNEGKVEIFETLYRSLGEYEFVARKVPKRKKKAK